MSAQDRVLFISGIVEGLAYARYKSDGKQTAGLKCIDAWFFDNKNGKDGVDTIELIDEAFGRFPKYPPEAIIDMMAKEACP